MRSLSEGATKRFGRIAKPNAIVLLCLIKTRREILLVMGIIIGRPEDTKNSCRDRGDIFLTRRTRRPRKARKDVGRLYTSISSILNIWKFLNSFRVLRGLRVFRDKKIHGSNIFVLFFLR